nr:hypothetical protein [Fictibacillus macauensis]
MTEQMVLDLLDELRNNKIEEYVVKKADFFLFRDILMKQEDKKSFRGVIVPGGGGDILYSYQPGWTA